MTDSHLDENISAENRFTHSLQPTAPAVIEPVLYSTISHLERFDAMLPRWRELKQGGVRFADDFPYATTQKGWTSRRKLPLPFLAASRLTITDTALALHGIKVPNQKVTRTLAFKLIEQSITTQYHNLTHSLDLTIAWSSVQNIDWHIAKPHDEIGKLPPTSHYVLIEHDQSDTAVVLQAAPPFVSEPLDLSAAKLAAWEAEQLSSAEKQNSALFDALRTRWQNAIAKAA